MDPVEAPLDHRGCPTTCDWSVTSPPSQKVVTEEAVTVGFGGNGEFTTVIEYGSELFWQPYILFEETL